MVSLALLMPGNLPCSLSFDYDHHTHPMDLVDIFPSLVFLCTLALSSHPVPGLFLSILETAAGFCSRGGCIPAVGNVTPDIWEIWCRASGAVKLRDVTHPGSACQRCAAPGEVPVWTSILLFSRASAWFLATVPCVHFPAHTESPPSKVSAVSMHWTGFTRETPCWKGPSVINCKEHQGTELLRVILVSNVQAAGLLFAFPMLC